MKTVTLQEVERTEADRLFTGLLLGTVISLPFNLAFTTLWQSSAIAARQRPVTNRFRPVNDILGKVRRDGKLYSLKSFITPNEPLIQELASTLYQDGNFVRDAQDFVHSEIIYKRERGDFWKLPMESLIDGKGDCEDSSLLLASLLLNYMAPEDVYCVAGGWGGEGHCWVVAGYPGWHIIESTASSTRTVKESGYRPQIFFNDQYAWAGPSDFDFILVGKRYCFELT